MSSKLISVFAVLLAFIAFQSAREACAENWPSLIAHGGLADTCMLVVNVSPPHVQLFILTDMTETTLPSGATLKAIFPKSVWALQSPDMGELPVGVPKSAGAGAKVGKPRILGTLEMALHASDTEASKATIKINRTCFDESVSPPLRIEFA